MMASVRNFFANLSFLHNTQMMASVRKNFANKEFCKSKFSPEHTDDG
jgi:hypothetical protein